MTIIQELWSKDGNLRATTISNVTDFARGDNVTLKGFKQRVSVIWLSIRRSPSYPLAFLHRECRDKAFEVLKANNEDVLVLDLAEYFFYQTWPQEKVDQVVNIRLTTHLRHCLAKIAEKERCTISELTTRDAFNCFSNAQLISLSLGGSIELENEDKLRTWAKTLFIPRTIERRGINPLQFFKSIYKNERNFNDGSNRITIK